MDDRYIVVKLNDPLYFKIEKIERNIYFYIFNFKNKNKEFILK